MMLNTLFSELQELNRADKLRVMQFLVLELAKEENALFAPGASYPVWSPHDAFDAADTLMKLLRDEKGNHHAE
jgi:hypothetical protein